MKLSILSAAIIGALIAGSGVYYYLEQGNKKPSTNNSQIALGKTQVGEITSQSTINLSNGVYSSVFDISLPENRLLKAEVSGALRARMSVLKQNQLIELTLPETQCSSCSNEEDLADTMVFKSSEAGVYQIAVSGLDNRAYGPFALKVTELQNAASGPLPINTEVYDWGSGPALSYVLPINEEGVYTIDLKTMTAGLDPFLELKTQSGTLLAQDDDGGSNLNSRLSYYLKPGEYAIRTSSATRDNNFKGGFALKVSHDELKDNAIELEREGGELHLDGVQRTGLYIGQQVPFNFELTELQLVTIQFKSDTVTGKVHLGPYESRQMNDGGQQLRAVLPAGQYQLMLNAETQSGFYDLSAQAQSFSAPPQSNSLVPNQSIEALLVSQVDANLHTLEIATAGQYTIRLESERFDTYLKILKNNEVLHEDDDSGGDLNSEMSLWLEPDAYQVLATSFDELPQSYPYILSAQAE